MPFPLMLTAVWPKITCRAAAGRSTISFRKLITLNPRPDRGKAELYPKIAYEALSIQTIFMVQSLRYLLWL